MTSHLWTRAVFRHRSFLVCSVAGALAACNSEPEPEPEPFSIDDARVVGVGSASYGPNGLAVGLQGEILAASVLGDEITVHDPATGEILDRIGPERGVHGPDDVVVAPDGTIYWTEILAGNVGLLAPDGTFRTQALSPGVNPIALSDDGRLFVSHDFIGKGLYELDPQLLDPATPILPDLENLNGMEFGPDGLLYGPLFFEGSIVRIDVDAAMPGPEVVAEGLRVPAGVSFSPDGELYAVDFAEGQVLHLDLVTGERQVLLDIEGVLDNLVVAPDGRIYTSAFPDGLLLAIDPDGEVQELGEPGLIAPGGVAVVGGLVWVADFFSLRGFGDDPTPERSFYDRFDPPGEGLASCTTVAALGDDLVTSGWFSESIQVLDPASGEVLEDIRTVAVPTNAIAHGDRLVAASLGAAGVVDARTGEVLLDGLTLPLGLASDGDTLYVGDWAAGTIQALAADGSVQTIASALASPEGLALDGDRLLVVEEGNDRVVGIDLSTGERSPVIVGLDLGRRVIPTALEYGMFNGVAVKPDGAILVTSDVTNTTYELK